MNLKLYDTLSRDKRAFVPADPDRVTMYVCGPTVYSYAHIGNARPVVVFDVLFRLLRRQFGEGAVVYARNVTDVDDKINAKAADEGVDISVITSRYLAAYQEDMRALGALDPTLQPKATAHMADIVEMIGKLVDNGSAYAVEGHVLFDTQAFKDYGALSGRNLDEMIAGARVEVASYKKNPADFVLWKPSKPGEPVWDSPWGPGRPGWHIECSAMIDKTLGLPIDIHGGGIDLVFPHHENEVAQGRCAHGGDTYARWWMHNGFLTIDAEKMSKSVGNVTLPHELLKTIPGEVLRWALLSAHYRAPLDWTGELLDQSRDALDKFYQVLLDAKRLGVDEGELRDSDVAPFFDALADDLNTPAAFAALFGLYRDLRETLSAFERKTASNPQAGRRLAAFLAAANAIGFLTSDPEAWFQGAAGDDLKSKVEALITARAEARKTKDWPAADRIRDKIAALGVEVMDGPQGATWRLRE